ncbi:hypothetical protein AMTRI_Chr13g117900 [Amborella trichopoda]|uniref:nuclear transcription factor Y subunit C-6 n=1 Tax=Amborella trichopoda TaxID=13333 RepID=UPI0009C10D31|nr:nuclear transcription factor Y subunit C-6 [Amborella trichopoda]XP_020520743.1 nuclear transcription factor Y subunit C-6 [Amborella trichopoda]|eukprot:XP_020520742.1 nuclear transcription factor Y subunit C-6 [Amborella trichopoda]
MNANHQMQFQASSSSFTPHPQTFIPTPPHMLFPQQNYQPEGGQYQVGESIMSPRIHYILMQKQHLRLFWQRRMIEMEQISEFRQHQLPLARIKKIMKSDDDVKMISAETPILFAKACELFILELTLRAWLHTEECKRRTLQRSDIAGAIRAGEVLDFLVDVVPMEEFRGVQPFLCMQDDQFGVNWSGNESLPYSGMQFPKMNPRPFNQILPEDVTSRQHEIPQQMMLQQPFFSNSVMYDPPQ